MSTIRRITKNVVSLASAEFLTKFIMFILIVSIARHLGDVNYGKFSFVMAYTSFFLILSDLGLSTLTIREVAKNKELAGKYFGNLSLVKLILSVISFILLVIIINLMDYPPDTTLAVYIAGVYVVINSFNKFFISFFRAFERMEYETFVRVFERVIAFTLVISLIYLNYGLIEIMIAFLVSGILSFLISCLIMLKRFTKPEFNIDVHFLKYAIKEALPFGLIVIFGTIYFKIDTVMLSIMKGDAVVGWYNAAYNIMEGLAALVAGSISYTFFPIMSRYYAESLNEKLKETYFKAFLLLFGAGLVISVFVTIFSDKIILILYGEEYLNSIIALKILIWAFFIICISMISSTLLNSIGKQSIVAMGTGLGAVLNVILNLVLIPKYSYIGAAYATLITEGVGFGIYLYFVLRAITKK